VPENGTGPPKGSVGDTPFAPSIPMEYLGARTIATDDPGHQPPLDPLRYGDPYKRAGFVYRDLPLVTIQNSWAVVDVRTALAGHMSGVFELSGQLVDSILGDDRVQATMGSRLAALFGREVQFAPTDDPELKDSDAARECLDAWQGCWPRISAGFALHQMHRYAILMGWSNAQLVWDTTGSPWCPTIVPWHQRFEYYHWMLRRYIAISLDGELPIVPGDGKWVLHAPYGEYRAWTYGALRAVAEPWMLRHFALRDWGRYSEVHGLPIRKAIVPAASAQDQRDRYQQSVSALGSDTSIMIPRGVDGSGQDYDLELLEARDRAWESFPGLRDHCDMAIVLAILFQNLTTEVHGGSLAATSAHMDVRQSGAQGDNEAWAWTLREQIARPFAYLNFGDARLAPRTRYDVAAKEDYEHNAKQMLQFGTAIEVLRRGGVEFIDTEALRKFAAENFGLRGLPDFKITTPVSGGGLGK
jgi:phage gp29-like protein